MNKEYYTLEEIVDITFFSLSKVKYIISKMGITPNKIGKYNYYTCYQLELIKENDARNYTKKYIILNSKINYYDKIH